jgi:hypothetical protein
MVFDPSETYLYSADMWANRIWCHRKIDEEGRLETVGFTEAPAPKDHPRWVEMHPSGNYLYALMEAGNRLCEYVIDPQTKLPVYTHKTYPLIPPGKPCTEYCPDRRSTDGLRYPERNHDVPLRRLLPHSILTIPFRDLALQFLLPHGVYCRIQDRSVRRHRATDLPQPHTDFWWALERGFAVSLVR